MVGKVVSLNKIMIPFYWPLEYHNIRVVLRPNLKFRKSVPRGLDYVYFKAKRNGFHSPFNNKEYEKIFK